MISARIKRKENKLILISCMQCGSGIQTDLRIHVAGDARSDATTPGFRLRLDVADTDRPPAPRRGPCMLLCKIEIRIISVRLLATHPWIDVVNAISSCSSLSAPGTHLRDSPSCGC